MDLLSPLVASFTCFGTTDLPNKSKVESDCKNDRRRIKHAVQLQLSDALGFAVPHTEFWVDITIVTSGPEVTLYLPLINFETGKVSPDNPNYPNAQSVQGFPIGGYLFTRDGFLPKEFRPAELLPHSIIAASNNGFSLVFSLSQDPSTLPKPPAGYIVQVTNTGALQVQGAHEFGNIIPSGPHILLPVSISYTVEPVHSVQRNLVVDPGFTNVTNIQNALGYNIGLRDTHVNDAFDGIAAFAWSNNSTVSDKTSPTTNVFVSIGKIDKKTGKLKLPRKPYQLTHLSSIQGIFDTAITINRANRKNIVVSYGFFELNANSPFGGLCSPYRAVSFDGGKSWPYNGPTNIQPVGPLGLGDCRGVASDKYGNIWYSATSFSDPDNNDANRAFFLASSDGGVSYQLVYTIPLPDPTKFPSGTFYTDFPQITFGGDGSGNYGLWFQTTFYNYLNGDGFPTVGFIPISGAGQWSTSTTTNPAIQYVRLPHLTNSIGEMDLTASSDGQVWFQGIVAPSVENSGVVAPFNYNQPTLTLYKAAGPIDQHYSGPWDSGTVNSVQFNTNPPAPSNLVTTSEPFIGYFPGSQCIIYDEKRKALYYLQAARVATNSQNMYLCFRISRNNGQTLSSPINISNSEHGNRGFPSMALDTVTDCLVFGWYDGRNDPTYKSVQYYAASFDSKTLDKLVNEIN